MTDEILLMCFMDGGISAKETYIALVLLGMEQVCGVISNSLLKRPIILDSNII